ncbi:MAG: glycosyltransferase family 39 protein [Burkholderiaceae bacterium]
MVEPSIGTNRYRNALLLLAVVLALVWFGGLGHRKLIKPDEGRYAEIPREMVASGDWLTPRLNDLKYFEKPPLQYWATAAAYESFGISEWTSRLWTALTGFLGVLVVGYTASRLYGGHAGLYAATVLASSLAYVLLAHFNTLDMGLSFFMSVTLCAALLARSARAEVDEPDAHCGSPPDQAQTRAARWIMLAWAAMALAVLSKGPVAAVLSGGALVLYVLFTRDWTQLKMLAPVRGLATFLLIAAPWFIAVSRANPEFAHFFFIHEHVERFLTTEHKREGPVWYFVPVLLIGLLPWLSIACSAVARAWRAPAHAGFFPQRMLLAWSLVIFVFFSVSGSKLPSYVLPMFPALALLIAGELVRIDLRTLKKHLIGIAVLSAIAFVVGAFIDRFIDSRENAAAVAAFRNAALVSISTWLVGSIAAVWLVMRARASAAILAAGFAALLGWSSLLLGHEALGRGMSTYDLARAMQPYIQDATPIYSVGIFEHTLDFYLQRTVTLVAFRDELDFGLTQEPGKGIATLPEFEKRWSQDRAPLAVMDRDLFDKLTTDGLAMRVVADDARRLVIAKPGAP